MSSDRSGRKVKTLVFAASKRYFNELGCVSVARLLSTFRKGQLDAKPQSHSPRAILTCTTSPSYSFLSDG
ncbi:hypothetical protein WG66_011396 [Moniliophthora roreri]|nr:hypothetical protein WG66_011396 [Moniliophthora roreri]